MIPFRLALLWSYTVLNPLPRAPHNSISVPEARAGDTTRRLPERPWGDLIIPHMSLSLSPRGQPVDRAIHLGTKVYIIKPIRTIKGITTRTSVMYDVPVGIQGTVMQYATRKGGEAYGRARTNQIQNCYAVAFRLKTVRWMEVICSSKEFNYFEALSPAEDVQYNARLRHALPPDTVVGNE
ncbi:hypothetical protein BC628DRAFT_806486 [Trametes gibbosa]|nr:hypothetical protein BC628DRAFT_806486 [Trametes gibbosa]